MGVQMQIASVALTMLAAREQKKAYEIEAQAYEEQASAAKIQAGQQETERNRQLRRQLASLGTSMSAQGVAIGTSPSVGALADDEVRMAKADIDSIRFMGSTARRKFQLSAAGSRQAGRAAIIGGFAKSAQMGYSINQGVSPGSGTKEVV